jgi:gliding motility-associated-like protein
MFSIISKRLIIVCILAASFLSTSAQINITPNQTAAMLAQTLAGSGVQVFNATMVCPGNANGTFQKVLSVLPVDSGIILTSGEAKTVYPPSAILIGADTSEENFSTTDNEAPGDADLTTIANQTTNDACVLEFDFIPSGDTAKFDYIFASEEYNGRHGNYNCSINDVFGFFISGPGYIGLNNIALVPGTNIPVGVSTVNDGVGATPGSSCYINTNGNGPYTQYYNNNVNDTNFVYSGFTDVFTAVAAVTPCSTYHLKLAIADAGDFVFDSGVFIKAGSLTSTPPGIQPHFDGGLPYSVRGCYPGYFTFSRQYPKATPLIVRYLIQGTAVNGFDYNLIPDSVIIPANQTSVDLQIMGIPAASPMGPVSVKLLVLPTSCTAAPAPPVDSATVIIYDQVQIDLLNQDTTVCESSPVQLHYVGDPSLAYIWSPTDGLSDPNSQDPIATLTSTTTYSITANLPNSGCPSVTKSFTIFVEPIPKVTITTHDTAFCLHDPYMIQASVYPDTFHQYSYTWSPATDLDDPSLLQPYFFNLNPDAYRFKLTVTTPIGCTGSDSATITTRPAPELTDVSSDFTAKYGEVVSLHAAGATFYTWTPTRLLDFPDEPDPHATAIDTATFQVIGTDQYGCRDTAYVKMDVDYTMTESIASAFSPNNDGRNDVFHISNLKYQRVIEFRVFNRWGQEVFSTTDGAKGWDGTFKGAPQEVGVYHYLIRITTPEGKMRTYKGDVTLIR